MASKTWNEEVQEAASTNANATLEFSSNQIINQKVKEATVGLQKYVYKKFVDFPTDNDKRLLADFILATMREQSMNKPSTKKSAVIALSYLLKHFNYEKSFTEISSQDLTSFLDTLSKVKEKDEFGKVIRVTDQFRDHSIDPNQKWIRTYNTYASSISKFYRWVHRPDLSNKDRRKLKGDQLPEVLKGVTNMWITKNEKHTSYEPEDLWYPEDDVIFLKYCKHNTRLRFYHALAIDAGSRPCELLPLKIKDIKIEKGSKGQLYARLRVGRYGKMEESRPVPMHNSIKYYRAYLSTKHPEGANPNPDAYIFASREHSALGKASTKISEGALYNDYMNYRDKILPRLLKQVDIPQADKQELERIRDFKKWNPYTMRHSAITRLARNPNIKESDLVKIGGWKNNNMLHQIYKNTSQDEAYDDVMLGLGIDTRSEDKRQRQEYVNEQLKGIFCPNCAMENLRDTKFCSQCHFVLTAEEANKLSNETQEEFENMKRQMRLMKVNFANVMKGVMAMEMGIKKSPGVTIYQGDYSEEKLQELEKKANEGHEHRKATPVELENINKLRAARKEQLRLEEEEKKSSSNKQRRRK